MSDLFSKEMKRELNKLIDKKLDGQMNKYHEDMNELVSKNMLELIPSYNQKISKEIKSHLVALAEFIIKTFKEKE